MRDDFLWIACAVVGLCLCAQSSPAPARLAIISEASDTLPAADLLTAEFSKNDNLQLLERTEIEKIIREQQLSLNNLDRLKLGRLLGADGLLAVRPATEGTNRFLSVQLIAVKPGVILADERLGQSVQDASAWQASVMAHLAPLLPKLSVLPQDAVPISVVNFHAGVRTTAAAELERQIFFLTVERLVRETRLFVLERKRMKALSEEKEMSGVELEPFWNGKYLLDGTIDRNGFNPALVTISARLIPPGGAAMLIEASGNRTNCVEVANDLAAKVLAALKLEANPTAWNTADEADKFFKEAKWNLDWQIFPEAQRAAEAAWALGKRDPESMKLRVRTFMPPPDVGVRYFPPREKPNPQKIEDAIQAARLYQEFSRNLTADEPKADTDWYKLGIDNLTIATRVLQQFNWSPENYQPSSSALAELRAQARAMAALLSRAPSVHASYYVGDQRATHDTLGHFYERSSIYGLKVEGGCLWQEKPEDEVALYRELMSSPVFAYLHTRFWFRQSDSICSLPWLPNRLIAWNEADQKRLPKLWEDFVQELRNSPDVLLQMEARALRLADTVSLSDMLNTAGSPEAYKIAYQEYERQLSSACTDFLDAFVINRAVFVTNRVELLYLNWGVDELLRKMGGNVVTEAKEALERRYQTEYGARLAEQDQQVAKAVAAAANLEAFGKQMEFLHKKPPYEPNVFVQMFTFGFKDYSHEQAQAIKPLLADYKSSVTGTWARIGQFQIGEVEANVEKILNPTAVATASTNLLTRTNGSPVPPLTRNSPPGRLPGGPGAAFRSGPLRPKPDREVEAIPERFGPAPLVSSNVVVVKNFYPLPLDGLPGGDPSGFRITDHQLLEGKLLLDFEYTAWVYSFDPNGDWRSSASKGYSGVALFDPASSRWQIAVLPDLGGLERGTTFSHHSTLWRGALYSSNNGKVQKFDRQRNTWDTNALPVSGNCQLYNLNGKLYVADNNSIQQIHEDARGTTLLASIQRQPAVTSLDSQGTLVNLALFQDAQNSLCAGVHNKVFRWDGADWREIGGAPCSFEPSVFDSGVLFLTDGWNTRPARISCFDMRGNVLETCLISRAQRPTQPGHPSYPESPEGLPKPLWDLPKELSLPNLSATYWQSNLFLMTDHSVKQDVVTEQSGTVPDGTTKVFRVITGQKFLPQDGYDSALFYFSRGQAAAGMIRLRFDNPAGCPPMAGLGSNSRPLIPQIGLTKCWMLFTPQFLFCGREILGGFSGSSEPTGFKPGIWAIPVDTIVPKDRSLK